jgi:hypothetical protein
MRAIAEKKRLLRNAQDASRYQFQYNPAHTAWSRAVPPQQWGSTRIEMAFTHHETLT